METEKHAVEVVNQWAFFSDPLLWSCIAMVVLGTVARVFKSDEPIRWRELGAEMILAGIGAVGIFAAAEIQGYGVYEKIFASTMMSLGGIHLIQRGLQVAQTIKRGG